MTNYPRDEFDRVPEFNTRVGSHHANGWAQSAASKSSGGKLRWVVIAAVLVVLVGAVAYFFGPGGVKPLLGSAPEVTESSIPTPSQEPSASPSETESAIPSASSTIDDDDVLFGQLVGVYNGASIAGIASAGQEALTDAGFTNVTVSNWTRPAETSTVYYTSEAYRTTAEKAAELMNIDEVLQTTNIPNRVTVVMGADDTLEVQ
ncbi:LytR C-terminal domain-containing protein [Glutamicibacter sp. NPDC087344]|uniref:LytR C-terminal domain-containing protein n=1 Tax=Glutamicibacter sp. NPDC087344 TaxID=3363994 RepID=UPI00380E991D